MHLKSGEVLYFDRSVIPIATVTGNTGGLKPKQLKDLERLAQKKGAPDEILGRETARSLAAISTALNRRIGLLIHRSGQIESVIVGDYDRIVIPALSTIRTSGGRLRGLRCVHTVLGLPHRSMKKISWICLSAVGSYVEPDAA